MASSSSTFLLSTKKTASTDTTTTTSRCFDSWVKELNATKSPDDFLRESMIATRVLPDKKSIAPPQTYIKSRLTWTNTVAEIHQLNEKNAERCKYAVMTRLMKMGFSNPEIVLEKSIRYLQDNTAVVVAFNASFLNSSGLESFQLGNLFERNTNKGSSYKEVREKAEKGLFSTTASGHTLLSSALARPRYGSLILLDQHNQIQSVYPSLYGYSFCVMANHVKLNCLFAPSDTLNYRNHSKKNYVLSSFLTLETFLEQCNDKKLRYIAERATNVSITALDGYDPYHCANENGYIEVLLPAVNVLDCKDVKHIHLVKKEYTLASTELANLRSLGLSISNSSEEHYCLSEEKKTSITAKEDSILIRENIDQIILLKKAFQKSQEGYETKNNTITTSISQIEIIFSGLADGKVVNAPDIILGCILSEKLQAEIQGGSTSEEFARRLQKLLNIFNIDSKHYDGYLDMYLVYLATLRGKPAAKSVSPSVIPETKREIEKKTAAPVSIPIPPSEEKKKEASTPDLTLPKEHKQIDSVAQLEELDRLKRSFVKSLEKYKSKDALRLKSKENILNLFITLEINLIENAALILLGYLINQRNEANKSHRSHLFKKTSTYAKCLQRVLNHFNIAPPSEPHLENIYFHYINTVSASSSLRSVGTKKF